MFLLPCLLAAPLLHSAAEINDFFAHGEGRADFSITGVVQCAGSGSEYWTIVADRTGRTEIYTSDGRIKAGDKVALEGFAEITTNAEHFASHTNLVRLGKCPIEETLVIPLSDIDEQKHDLMSVRTEGTVVEITTDEVDAENRFLLLKDGETVMPVSLARTFNLGPKKLIDARVRLSGIFHRAVFGVRKFSGPYVSLTDSSDFEILNHAPDDPFAAPPLENRFYLTPREVARMDRRTVRGLVAATWGRNLMMIRAPDGRIVNIELAEGQSLPPCDSCGIVVGYPVTDLFRINLTRGRFKADGSVSVPDEEPEDTTAEQIVENNLRRTKANLYHGRLVRIRGIIRSLPSPSDRECRMLLDCGCHKVPVDVSSHPSIAALAPLGSEIEVTGLCLLETDNWRADRTFPRIRGFVLIPRGEADVRVLALPPWWTPARLFAVIAALFAALVSIFVWNRVLRHLVDRRSRELMKSQLENITSELRVEERTRLAMELHDSISQNLTGASMRVDAAQEVLDDNGEMARRLLTVASKTLISCREELRSCIWDLRNRAFEEKDLNEAIRKTVQPHLGKAKLTIRFNVPRTQVSENTLHALLRIIRELVSNAIRHGHATAIAIAGTAEESRLLFSVTDNGCGFDPEARPGVAEGHFGLQGIEERIRQFNGEMTIESKIGKGTRIAAWIKLRCLS